MRYQIAFHEQTGPDGRSLENPAEALRLEVPDGVILDANLIDQEDPATFHAESVATEDEDLFGYGTELWEFEVADSRTQEFEDAITRSGVVMEFTVLGED